MSEKKNIKERFVKWVNDPYNKIFVGIFAFALLLRIWIFLKTMNQPVWWDAADYLSEAKYFGGLLRFDYFFNPRRPFLLALLWGGLFRVGLGEISLRLTEIIFSIAAIPAIYFAGKEMFDEKIALISAFLLSIFWQHLFFSGRLMTEIPAITFFLFSVFFFWKGYVKKQERYLLWFGVFLGLSLLTRGGMLMLIVSLGLFILIVDKLNFLKNKKLWGGFIAAALLMSVFFVFIYFKEGGNPVSKYLGIGEGRFSSSRAMGLKGILTYSSFFPAYLGYALLIPFLIGLVLFLARVALEADLFLKNPKTAVKRDLFVFLWIFVPFLFLSIFVDHMEPRYLMISFPPLFFILGEGLMKIYEWVKPYGKNAGVFVVILFLVFGGYYQIKQTDFITTAKSTSYLPVKQAGIWIKEHSNPSDVVVSASATQTIYYSERKVIGFNNNEKDFWEDVNKTKPRYLVLSIFERHPKWAYELPQKHKDLLKPVQAYKQGDKPVLVIYEFDWGVRTNKSSSH